MFTAFYFISSVVDIVPFCSKRSERLKALCEPHTDLTFSLMVRCVISAFLLSLLPPWQEIHPALPATSSSHLLFIGWDWASLNKKGNHDKNRLEFEKCVLRFIQGEFFTYLALIKNNKNMSSDFRLLMDGLFASYFWGKLVLVSNNVNS